MCQPMIAEDPSSRVKSLRDPSKKMSKSDPDPKSCLMLTDTPEQITEKVKKAVTDFTSKVTYEPATRGGVTNLLTIHSMVSGKTVQQICEEVKDIDTGKWVLQLNISIVICNYFRLRYKFVVADALIEHLNPIRLKIEDYLKNPDYLSSVLADGGDRARETAEKTMDEVKLKVGLGQFGTPNVNVLKHRI